MNISDLCVAFAWAVALICQKRERLIENGSCFSEDGYWCVKTGKDYVVMYGNNEKDPWVLALYKGNGFISLRTEESLSEMKEEVLTVRRILIEKINEIINKDLEIPVYDYVHIRFSSNNIEKRTNLPMIELNKENIYKILDLNLQYCMHLIDNNVKTAVAGMPNEERIPLEKQFYEEREKFIAEHWDSWTPPKGCSLSF